MGWFSHQPGTKKGILRGSWWVWICWNPWRNQKNGGPPLTFQFWPYSWLFQKTALELKKNMYAESTWGFFVCWDLNKLPEKSSPSGGERWWWIPIVQKKLGWHIQKISWWNHLAGHPNYSPLSSMTNALFHHDFPAFLRGKLLYSPWTWIVSGIFFGGEELPYNHHLPSKS